MLLISLPPRAVTQRAATSLLARALTPSRPTIVAFKPLYRLYPVPLPPLSLSPPSHTPYSTTSSTPTPSANKHDTIIQLQTNQTDALRIHRIQKFSTCSHSFSLTHCLFNLLTLRRHQFVDTSQPPNTIYFLTLPLCRSC
jgi:hypothetical protein